jgi:transcriptional regulator NrdR family protein
MKCPHCGTKESRVKKTLIHIEEVGFAFGELKKRERQCLSCDKKFYTYELHESVFRQLPARNTLEESVPVSRRPVRRPLDLRPSL